MSTLWRFFLPNDARPHGFLLDSTVQKISWPQNEFRLDVRNREVHLLRPSGTNWERRCDWVIAGLLHTCRGKNLFPSLGASRNEKYAILGAKFPIGIDRSASHLFGIVITGVHLNIYVETDDGIKVWLARRSFTKDSFPGKLDNAVAGGVALGEAPLDAIARETEEETGLMKDYARKHVEAAGTISWIHIDQTPGEPGFIVPGVSHVYDLKLESDVDMKPVDDDIEEFILVGVNELKALMLRGDFKPMCANVMVDFLIRHGFITKENEEDFEAILDRFYRKLPFPVLP